MGWFKDFFFGDMDEEIDTYEDTSSRKVEKKAKQRASEVLPKSNVTAIKTKRTYYKERTTSCLQNSSKTKTYATSETTNENTNGLSVSKR